MSEQLYLANDKFMKELPTLQDYIKNTFLNKDNEKIILNNISIENFNERRIKTYLIYTTIIPNNAIIYNKTLKYFKVLDNISMDDLFSCWIILSKMVEKREAIGFPIVYKYCINKSNNRCNNTATAMFESNISNTNYTSVYEIAFSPEYRLMQIKFQKLLISYILYKNNIYYNGKLQYDIYDVPKTSIVFKIEDLYFNFKLITLVVLSPLTKLFYSDGINGRLERIYINDALEDHMETTNDNFIEYFINNLQNYMDYNNIPTVPAVVVKDLENINERPVRGRLVKIKSKETDKYVYGILADYYDDNYKIYSIVNTSKVSFKYTHILDRSEIYKSEKVIAITHDYTIGRNDTDCFY
ncbi:internal Virion Protein (Cop-L3L) [Mythimna separata entomopoxvirus 'L']|uniref:Internal Virion Protein (Cop-L3L) n=1 Tax=Mythimna separata entomopoxvirus 'L' TaxID=1293572 RepID=A0A916P1R2_9POXV|nr:internal Virion Protein (Cop-L3L) [Mythimna separata entomopoxvirus 'L']CCU56290.1 internal Virion Protein (Cop-L3L) [Mythimna separata entomopoxvirus 'L']